LGVSIQKVKYSTSLIAITVSSILERTSVSVVIPSLNRCDSLKLLVTDLLQQSLLPTEIIVVDDSDNDRTKNMLNVFSDARIIHIKPSNPEMRSITRARNIGVKKATGQIIVSLDDDIRLHKNYIREIAKVFGERPEILGIQGPIANVNNNTCRLGNLFNRLFFLVHKANNKAHILPSGRATIPCNVVQPIVCEWFSGTNGAYRKEILQEFQFNEKLRGYSLCEDMDLSYRIHKKYPNSLMLIPEAKIVHNHSLLARRKPKELMFVDVTYHLYFFLNYIERSPKNWIIYLWSMLGNIIQSLDVTEISYRLKLHVWAFKHMNEIKQGNFQELLRKAKKD
jgi:glycosyltransferase involved in cell wall biosynthesis